jgi:hypothetical protein
MGLEAAKVTQVLRDGTSVLADIRGPDLLSPDYYQRLLTGGANVLSRQICGISRMPFRGAESAHSGAKAPIFWCCLRRG